MTTNHETLDRIRETNADQIHFLTRDLGYINSRLKDQGITIRLKWVHAQGQARPYLYSVVYDYKEMPGLGIVSSKADDLTFRELQLFVRGITQGLELSA